MDFADLGKHCFVCKQQDYLPIKCFKCEHYFCSKHASGHICNVTVDNIKKVKKINTTTTTRYRCTYVKCKQKKVPIDISCKYCKKRMCIFHRFPTDHECVVYNKNIEFKKKILEDRHPHKKGIDPLNALRIGENKKTKSKGITVMETFNKDNKIKYSCCNIS